MEFIIFLILVFCFPEVIWALIEIAFVLFCGAVVIGIFFMILSQL